MSSQSVFDAFPKAVRFDLVVTEDSTSAITSSWFVVDAQGFMENR